MRWFEAQSTLDASTQIWVQFLWCCLHPSVAGPLFDSPNELGTAWTPSDKRPFSSSFPEGWGVLLMYSHHNMAQTGPDVTKPGAPDRRDLDGWITLWYHSGWSGWLSGCLDPLVGWKSVVLEFPEAQSTQDVGHDAQCKASKWDLLMWVGVSTLHASIIKGKTFQFARASRPASCVDWAWTFSWLRIWLTIHDFGESQSQQVKFCRLEQR